MVSMRVLVRLAGLTLLLCGAMALLAQINRGVIEGLVTDPQGAVMSGVQIEVIAVDTNITSRVTSNDAGSYRVVDLVPGKYRARFSFSGFSTLDLTDIDVPAGKVTRLDTQMRVDATRQTVEVKAEAPLLESGAANFSTTLETKTNALAAEYSRTGGGVFNVVLKSGTNQLHGNLYEFLRNDATNARNPFTSIDEQGHLIKDRQLRFNNFGFTVGGPVVLPHVYNGKDKTFFFFSSDFTKLHLLGYKNFTVPTDRMRQCQFSEDAFVSSNGVSDPCRHVRPHADGVSER